MPAIHLPASQVPRLLAGVTVLSVPEEPTTCDCWVLDGATTHSDDCGIPLPSESTVTFTVDCPDCDGGIVYGSDPYSENRCRDCQGSGQVPVTEEVELDDERPCSHDDHIPAYACDDCCIISRLVERVYLRTVPWEKCLAADGTPLFDGLESGQPVVVLR